jgi:hypothetical protein
MSCPNQIGQLLRCRSSSRKMGSREEAVNFASFPGARDYRRSHRHPHLRPQCPLWVKSRRSSMIASRPLYPPKQTLIAALPRPLCARSRHLPGRRECSILLRRRPTQTARMETNIGNREREFIMANNDGNSGLLGVFLGGLLVLVVGGAVLYATGVIGNKNSVTITLPKVN